MRKGIKPHTSWDDILEIVQDMQGKDADLIVTLGAGSLTDGAKIISFVSGRNCPSGVRLVADSKGIGK